MLPTSLLCIAMAPLYLCLLMQGETAEEVAGLARAMLLKGLNVKTSGGGECQW